jgi:hypothetical protein
MEEVFELLLSYSNLKLQVANPFVVLISQKYKELQDLTEQLSKYKNKYKIMKITSIENGHLVRKCTHLVCPINHWKCEIIILLFDCTHRLIIAIIIKMVIPLN